MAFFIIRTADRQFLSTSAKSWLFGTFTISTASGFYRVIYSLHQGPFLFLLCSWRFSCSGAIPLPRCIIIILVNFFLYQLLRTFVAPIFFSAFFFRETFGQLNRKFLGKSRNVYTKLCESVNRIIIDVIHEVLNPVFVKSPVLLIMETLKMNMCQPK